MRKKYKTIVADPPWSYPESGGGNRVVNAHYKTMSNSDIYNMPVSDIADKDCVLYLWATAPKLDIAMRTIAEWGFRYKTCAVWDKGIIGMGYWFRGQHELLLVGTRGKVTAPATHLRVSSIIKERRTKHSKKPDCVQDMIMGWFPDSPRVELFARREREGWDVWGNEVRCTAELASDL